MASLRFQHVFFWGQGYCPELRESIAQKKTTWLTVVAAVFLELRLAGTFTMVTVAGVGAYVFASFANNGMIGRSAFPRRDRI